MEENQEEVISNEVDKKETITSKVLGWVGAIVGLVIGKYSGVHLLIPAIGTVAAWFILSKTVKSDARAKFIPAISLQAGHLFWFCFGIFAVGGIESLITDIIVLSGGIIWLLARPGIAPVLFLCAIQMASLLVNGFSFSETTINTTEHKALLIHIILRASAIIALVLGYIKFKKAESHADSS